MADLEIETDHRLATVARSVEDDPRHEGPYKAVVATEVYPSPPAVVWEAITDAERLSRWFLPVTGDLRLGARSRWRATPGARCWSASPRSGSS